MSSIPSGQADMGSEWVTGLARLPRGEYRDKVWNGTTWPLVWCEEEQRWYVGRTRFARDTLGVSPEGLKRRLDADAVVSQGANTLLVPSGSGDQPTACFLFDDLPYVLQGIEPNACRADVREDLIFLKRQSRDILRDVLIYGKIPEMLQGRSQGEIENRLIRIEDQNRAILDTLRQFDTLIKHAFWNWLLYVIDIPLDYARRAKEADWFLSRGYQPVKPGKANDMPKRLSQYAQGFGAIPNVRRTMMTDSPKAEQLLINEKYRPRGVCLMQFPDFENKERFWALPEHLTGLDTWPEGMSYVDLQVRFSGWRLHDQVLVPAQMKVISENFNS